MANLSLQADLIPGKLFFIPDNMQKMSADGKVWAEQNIIPTTVFV